MEKINKPKPIKLLAFKVENPELGKSHSDIVDNLSNVLNDSKLNDRIMQLNIDDPQKEEDLISNYDIRSSKFIFLTLLRIASAEGMPNITDNLLEKNKITITDLDQISIPGATKIYRGHHYYATDGYHIVTNMPINRKITTFQTYINWILKDTREDNLYEFTPLTIEPPETKFSEVKSINVSGTSLPLTTEEMKTNENVTKRFHLNEVAKKYAKAFVEKYVKDTKGVKDILKNNIVSADLLIKFAKKKNITKEDYQRCMGAILKPLEIGDENVSFVTKAGQRIKVHNFMRQKVVEIETTDSKNISEPQLSEEMERFLKELKEQ
jgi:hypothetical protein